MTFVTFCDPKRFAFAKNGIVVFVNDLDAHEGDIVDGMIEEERHLNALKINLV